MSNRSTEYNWNSNSTAERNMTPAEKKKYRQETIDYLKGKRALEKQLQAERNEAREKRRFITLRKQVAKNAAKKGKAMMNKKSGATATAKAKRELRKQETALKNAEEAAEKARKNARFGTRSMYRQHLARNSTRKNKK